MCGSGSEPWNFKSPLGNFNADFRSTKWRRKSWQGWGSRLTLAAPTRVRRVTCAPHWQSTVRASLKVPGPLPACGVRTAPAFLPNIGTFYPTCARPRADGGWPCPGPVLNPRSSLCLELVGEGPHRLDGGEPTGRRCPAAVARRRASVRLEIVTSVSSHLTTPTVTWTPARGQAASPLPRPDHKHLNVPTSRLFPG